MKRRPSVSQAADRAAWSIEEFAARYGISRSRVYQEIAAGKLKTSKIGARRVVTAAQEAAYLVKIGG